VEKQIISFDGITGHKLTLSPFFYNPMMRNMQPEDIKVLIEAGLKDCTAILDGDGTHFNATVISPEFSGKNRIQKQQLVYATLGNRIANGTIHAISIKTFTPDEWHQHNEES